MVGGQCCSSRGLGRPIVSACGAAVQRPMFSALVTESCRALVGAFHSMARRLELASAADCFGMPAATCAAASCPEGRSKSRSEDCCQGSCEAVMEICSLAVALEVVSYSRNDHFGKRVLLPSSRASQGCSYHCYQTLR